LYRQCIHEGIANYCNTSGTVHKTQFSICRQRRSIVHKIRKNAVCIEEETKLDDREVKSFFVFFVDKNINIVHFFPQKAFWPAKKKNSLGSSRQFLQNVL
jgi:hypothetical protein